MRDKADSKRSLFTVVCFVFLIALILSQTSFKKPSATVYADSFAASVRAENKSVYLLWNALPSADEYEVLLNGATLCRTSVTNINITSAVSAPGCYLLIVKALKNNGAIAVSSLSHSTYISLSLSSLSVSAQGNAQWTASAYSESFSVFLNDVPINCKITVSGKTRFSTDLSQYLLDGFDYTLKVKAISSSSFVTSSSVASAKFSAASQNHPKAENLYVLRSATGFLAAWSVDKAEALSYYCVVKASENFTSDVFFSTTKNYADITSYLNGDGDYKLCVYRANADGSLASDFAILDFSVKGSSFQIHQASAILSKNAETEAFFAKANTSLFPLKGGVVL
jgi:hypothetical protein